MGAREGEVVAEVNDHENLENSKPEFQEAVTTRFELEWTPDQDERV